MFHNHCFHGVYWERLLWVITNPIWFLVNKAGCERVAVAIRHEEVIKERVPRTVMHTAARDTGPCVLRPNRFRRLLNFHNGWTDRQL